MTFPDVFVGVTVADQIETCGHKKATSTDLYIKWNVHGKLEH